MDDPGPLWDTNIVGHYVLLTIGYFFHIMFAMMMTFETYLEKLGLSQTEAARLLSVSPRTVRRWVEDPDEVSGPANEALRAWIKLNERGIPWRPDGSAIGEVDPEIIAEQIAKYREAQIEQADILRRVDERGGPAAPWQVDLKNRKAALGPIRLSFYPLRDGGFSPQSWSRSDRDLDMERDQALLEDAISCIADAIKAAGPTWAKDS